jgi:hypothetical protein
MDYHHQDPVGVSVSVANEHWGGTTWSNPDPFATSANNAAGNDDSASGGMSGGLDPLAPGVAVVDYRV